MDPGREVSWGFLRVRLTSCHLVRVKLSFMINSSSIPKLVSSHLAVRDVLRNSQPPLFQDSAYPNLPLPPLAWVLSRREPSGPSVLGGDGCASGIQGWMVLLHTHWHSKTS